MAYGYKRNYTKKRPTYAPRQKRRQYTKYTTKTPYYTSKQGRPEIRTANRSTEFARLVNKHFAKNLAANLDDAEMDIQDGPAGGIHTVGDTVVVDQQKQGHVETKEDGLQINLGNAQKIGTDLIQRSMEAYRLYKSMGGNADLAKLTQQLIAEGSEPQRKKNFIELVGGLSNSVIAGSADPVVDYGVVDKIYEYVMPYAGAAALASVVMNAAV